MFEKHGPQWPLRWPHVVFVLSLVIFGARSASAQDPSVPPISASIATAVAQQPPPKVAFEYSEAYQTRAKIHKIASFATLPLFAAELWLGRSIYDTPSDSRKSAGVS